MMGAKSATSPHYENLRRHVHVGERVEHPVNYDAFFDRTSAQHPLAYIPGFFQDPHRRRTAYKGNSEDAREPQFLEAISTQSPYRSRGDPLAPDCLAKPVTHFCRKAFDVALQAEPDTTDSFPTHFDREGRSWRLLLSEANPLLGIRERVRMREGVA